MTNNFKMSGKKTRTGMLLLFLAIAFNLPAQTIGLYMRDFEGTSCSGIYGGCTQDDNGQVPSCNACGVPTCYLHLSNDMWLDTDNNGTPTGGLNYSLSSNGNCPEIQDVANTAQKMFVAVRVLINPDFFPAAGAAANFTYAVKVSIVQASAGIGLNNFTEIGTANVSFTRTAGNSISGLAVSEAGYKVAALATGIKDGFVVFVPWTAGATAGHFCLLAELTKTAGAGTFDAAPVRTVGGCITSDPLTTHTGYSEFIKCNDNAIWRNINVITPPSPAAPEFSVAETDIFAPVEDGWLTMLEVRTPVIANIPLNKLWNIALDWSKLPAQSRPDSITLMRNNRYLREMGWTGDFANIPIGDDRLVFPELKLPRGEKFPLRFTLRSKSNDSVMYKHMLHILQYEYAPGREPVLVGGNAFLLLSKKPDAKNPGDGGGGGKEEECTGLKCWFQKYPWLYALLAVLVILLGWVLLRRKKS